MRSFAKGRRNAGEFLDALQQSGDGRGGYLQFGKGEHLFAEVFQRGSDVIDFCPVDYQEAVMAFLVSMNAYRGILAVVFLQIQLQLVADGLRVDLGFHAGIPLAEHQQHRLVHVVVYQQQGLSCGADKVGGELVGVEQLTVVEDAFHGRQRDADKEVHLIRQVFYLPLVLLKLCIHLLQPIVDGIAFQQVFLQHFVRPTPEKSGVFAVYPITNGQDCVQIIIFGHILLLPIVTHMFQNGTCAVLIQFSAIVYIV